jgi:hypothetical protein
LRDPKGDERKKRGNPGAWITWIALFVCPESSLPRLKIRLLEEVHKPLSKSLEEALRQEKTSGSDTNPKPGGKKEL